MSSLIDSKPLISIITVCYNAENTIVRTIESVKQFKNQFPSLIEYVIIDGGSSDLTLSYIRNNNHVYDFLISEQDSGIYDAMNKGIKYSSGTYISFLNADDYYKTDSMSDVLQILNEKKYDCVYGNISSLYESKEKIVKPINEQRAKKFGYMTPIVMQPASFIKRDVYNTIGGFDLDFKIAGDTDFLIRFIKHTEFSRYYIDKVFTYFSTKGISNKGILNYREAVLLMNKNHIPRIKFTRYVLESSIKKMIFRSLLKFNILYK